MLVNLSQVCVATYDHHQGSARALAWDPLSNGQVFSSGARDGAICVWDLRQSSPAIHIHRAHNRSRRKRVPHSAGVTSLVYLENGQLVSSGSENAIVQGWDLKMPTDPISQSQDVSKTRTNNTRPHGISSLAYAAKRGRIYAACTDGSVYTLDSHLSSSLVPNEPSFLYHDTQRHNTLYAHQWGLMVCRRERA
ncbi:hypothetical protein MPSI1_000155 [Malassezia psittaci]|uniref:Uncharacterized protein n=1 Tax=Malassezia psittaci TaxID=1821823 RepID=A0AAF0F628_9BASI|nr:hypothetical protein MPSI1_000155 [Malassezia psittaci]